MSQNVRIYADKHLVTESPRVIEMGKLFRDLRERYGDSNENYLRGYKSACNFLRVDIGINQVLGFVINNSETQVMVVTFDVEATQDNYYTIHFDEEKNDWYIEE